MKTSLILGAMLLAAGVWAGEMPNHVHPGPIMGSKELQRMKALEGTWKGTGTDGKNTFDSTVVYHVTSNGSAVMETLDPGTEHEMITMYNDRGGKLGVTHYCSSGNQPRMTLIKADDKTLDFDFAPSEGIDAARDMHMHSLSLSLSDGKLTTKWTSWVDGKAAGTAHFSYTKAAEKKEEKK